MQSVGPLALRREFAVSPSHRLYCSFYERPHVSRMETLTLISTRSRFSYSAVTSYHLLVARREAFHHIASLAMSKVNTQDRYTCPQSHGTPRTRMGLTPTR